MHRRTEQDWRNQECFKYHVHRSSPVLSRWRADQVGGRPGDRVFRRHAGRQSFCGCLQRRQRSELGGPRTRAVQVITGATVVRRTVRIRKNAPLGARSTDTETQSCGAVVAGGPLSGRAWRSGDLQDSPWLWQRSDGNRVANLVHSHRPSVSQAHARRVASIEGDSGLAIILSKALMLAADTKITDPFDRAADSSTVISAAASDDPYNATGRVGYRAIGRLFW